MTNSFTTGITYHAYFLDYSCYHPLFANVYTFNIEPEQDTPHPIDKRIASTVIHILRQFFSRNENAMIMICDNLDGKEQKREMLFSRWFMQYNEEAYGNTMLRQLRMITCCMYLCSCIGTTQMPDSLSMLFIIWRRTIFIHWNNLLRPGRGRHLRSVVKIRIERNGMKDIEIAESLLSAKDNAMIVAAIERHWEFLNEQKTS